MVDARDEVVGQAEHHEVGHRIPRGFDPAGQVDGLFGEALAVGVFARDAQGEPDPLRVAQVEAARVDLRHVAEGLLDAFADLDGEILLQFAFPEVLRALGEREQGQAQLEEAEGTVLLQQVDRDLEVARELLDLVELPQLAAVLFVGLVLVRAEIEGVGQRVVQVLRRHALAQRVEQLVEPVLADLLAEQIAHERGVHDRLAQLGERGLLQHVEPSLGQVVQAMAGVFDPQWVDDLGAQVVHALGQ